ncbi:extracellular solute-binding protein [Dethiothermospora halolimnae]|uniref:extracellular solute-binding protein n=1 Tax=Dethiothermospora halolimnae TaxID=3114390 RepID=UPI003CCC20C2
MLILIHILLLVGCTNKSTDNSYLETEDKSKEITIAVWNKYIGGDGELVDPIIGNTRIKFGLERDVSVSYDIIYANTFEEYLEKLNIRLYQDNGPTLLYFYNSSSAKKYIEQGIALDVKNKIQNTKKLYDIFVGDNMYYIPIGMNYSAISLYKETLDMLDIKEPSLNWTKKDFLDIREKWLNYEKRLFTGQEYLYLVTYPYYELDIIDGKTKEIHLNNDGVKEFLRKTRSDIFSEKYCLSHDPDFYYNAIFNFKSKESNILSDEIKSYGDQLLSTSYSENTLKVRSRVRKNKNIIVLPSVYNKDLHTYGFMVNKNGKNVKLGLEFINELLSNENQMKLYTDEVYWFYPVNKEIEDEINERDKKNNMDEKYISMRKIILDRIKSQKGINYLGEGMKVKHIRDSIKKDFFKIIFSEKEYTDEELENKLIEMENKYQLYFRE